jgi:hypothetical protein
MSGHPHLFYIGQLVQARLEFVRDARGLPPGTERNQKRQIASSLKRLIGLQGGMPMPRYFSIFKAATSYRPAVCANDLGVSRRKFGPVPDINFGNARILRRFVALSMRRAH